MCIVIFWRVRANVCCVGKATVRFLSIFDIFLALRNIQDPSSVATQRQEWILVAQLFGYKIFLCTLNTISALEVFV